MRFDSFQEFYPFYLSQHRHPVTRALHVLGLLAVLALIILTAMTRRWWLLALIPVTGYGLAWVGHFFFEKNRPATFQYPLYSLRGDLVLFKDVLTGKVKILAILLSVVALPLFAQYPELLTETAPAESQRAQAVIRFTITNNGEDAGGKGLYMVYPAGERKKEIGYAYSAMEARLPAGTYDVKFVYRDGAVKKEIWQEKKVLEGLVDETVEMGVSVALVRFTLTNQGAPTEEHGRFAIYPAGGRKEEYKEEFIDVPSGEQIAVAAGTYDIRLRYKEGAVTKERWLARQVVEGNFEKSVEMSAAPALPESRPMPETSPQTQPVETLPAAPETVPQTRPAETQPAPETAPAPEVPAPPMIPTPPPNLTPVPVEPFIWRRWFGCSLVPDVP